MFLLFLNPHCGPKLCICITWRHFYSTLRGVSSLVNVTTPAKHDNVTAKLAHTAHNLIIRQIT